MGTKTKLFDCVEMKNRIQAEIMAEYQAREDEFSSLAEYLKATESVWESQVRQRLVQSNSGAK